MNAFIEKLIGRLEEYKKQWMDADYLDGIDEIIEIVNELAKEYKLFGNSEQVNGGWIPCDENLPKHGQTVIFSTEDGMVEAGWYDVNKDWCVNENYFPDAFKFIAWQPLPDPYIEK